MYAVENTVPSMVVDFGSHTTKFGSAGEDLPHNIFRSSVGIIAREDKRDYVCGNDLLLRRDNMEILSPFDEDGLISNWHDMEKLMDYTFRDISPEEFAFMIAEPTYNLRKLREKMCEVMFETYKVPALYLGRSAVLSAFASSRTTGIVLDIGASCVTAVPVFEGAVVKNKMLRSMTAGAQLTRHVKKQLERQGIALRPGYSVRKTRTDDGGDEDDDGGEDDEEDTVLRQYDVEELSFPKTTHSYRNYCTDNIAELVKETICRVNDQPLADPSLYPIAKYELPDGQMVEMGVEKFEAPSALFKTLPHVHLGTTDMAAPGTSSEGVSGLVYDAIQRCEPHMHKDMYSGICLTGGTSNFPGLYEQITNELLRKYHKARVLAATGAPERRYCAWTGGSILATFLEFQKNWFSKSEYDENGASFAHKKCT